MLLKNNTLISFFGVFTEMNRRKIDDNRAISAGTSATESAILSSFGGATGGTPAHAWRVMIGVRSPKSEVRTGAVIQKMLKMQDDPDELLKTKGKLNLKKLDPDGCLKIKELR
jgi:hypothetical protein